MEAKQGSHILAGREGTHGYYASVILEVEPDAQHGGVSVAFAQGVDRYLAGLTFGVTYAYEKSGMKDGARVRVLELRGHVVDTTEMVVAFAAAYAMWDALGVVPAREPELDAKTGLFSFAK